MTIEANSGVRMADARRRGKLIIINVSVRRAEARVSWGNLVRGGTLDERYMRRARLGNGDENSGCARASGRAGARMALRAAEQTTGEQVHRAYTFAS